MAATLAMTLWEWPFWRFRGLAAVPDWLVNQLFVSLLNRRPPEANLAWGLVLHFLAGAAGGVAFSAWLPASGVAAGLAFATALWVLVLALQRLLAGSHALRGAAGWKAAAVSLIGHWIYGAILGFAA